MKGAGSWKENDKEKKRETGEVGKWESERGRRKMGEKAGEGKREMEKWEMETGNGKWERVSGKGEGVRGICEGGKVTI
jgi:hypothetical protein